MRTNSIIASSNNNRGYGLNFDGTQEVLFNNNILALAQTYLQPNLPFSISIDIKVNASMFAANGQGNFLWLNNNSLYDGINTKGLNILSYDNSGIVNIGYANLTNGFRFVVCNISASDIGKNVNMIFTHDGNVFKSYYRGRLQQVGTSGTLTGTIDYTTGITAGIRYNTSTFLQKGVIYDIKIYNKELISAECMQHAIYNNVRSGLIYAIPFNQIAGATTHEEINNISASLVGYPIGSQPLRDARGVIVNNFTV